MDVSAIVISKLLLEQDLDAYGRIKLVFIDPAYSSLYAVINKYYEKYSVVPNFDDLEVTLREGHISNTLAAIKSIEPTDVPINVAIDALIDQYTQNETIKLLDKFIDKLPLYDSNEIKESLAAIAIDIEDKTYTSEKVYTMQDISIFQHPDEFAKERVYLGLNNAFDAAICGMAKQEVMFIGGMRGSGKSLICSNIFVNQYETGNTSLYFSIEMTAAETNMRNMSILANVNSQSLKQNKLTDTELLRVVKARAGMFSDSGSVLEEFMQHNDRFKFEEDLVRNHSLKKDNQMIIVDDRSLTLTSIDMHIGKAKARFGDKLELVVIDYINQIVVEGVSQYDWIPQLEIAKKLKNLARKYEIVIVSPYQIDATGEARFSKGILDSADIALILEAHPKENKAISFRTTKIRGASDQEFTSPIDWGTLRISSNSIDKPEKAKKEHSKKSTESPVDLPWEST